MTDKHDQRSHWEESGGGIANLSSCLQWNCEQGWECQHDGFIVQLMYLREARLINMWLSKRGGRLQYSFIKNGN